MYLMLKLMMKGLRNEVFCFVIVFVWLWCVCRGLA